MPAPTEDSPGSVAASLSGETVSLPAKELPAAEAATVPPTPAAPKAVPDGVALPGYEVLGLLGRGGMGVVYKARQVQADRVVALKMILHVEHAGDDERARFQTEARAIARLQHPHIIQIYEVGEHRGIPFFSLEFCSGGSLENTLAGTPLEAKAAAALVEKLARAMQAAHEAHVIHRDLKPANVLLTADGEPKITDFGLAKRLDEKGRTQTGALMGTPSYMAPEQAGGGKDVGPAADVYALGAILYECLTGRPPFNAATVMDTIMQVVADEPVPPRQLQSTTPKDLETICLKCLHKDPGKRYATAAQLAEDLGRFQRGEPIAARPVGRLERGWRWCRRNPALAMALATVAASLIAGSIVAAAFAMQAHEARMEAEQRAENEAAAKEQARLNEEYARKQTAEVENARNKLEKANDRLVSSLARSLVRPLGLQVQPDPVPPPSDPEIEALEELGGSEEKLRLYFVEESMRNPVTTRQLRDRAAFALHAVVGLDARRRETVERMLMERLSGKEVPLHQKVDLFLSLVELGDLKPRTATDAAVILTQTMNSMLYSLKQAEARTLSRGLSKLAVFLGPKEAKEVVKILIPAMASLNPYLSEAVAENLAAVAERLDPKETKLVQVVIALLTRKMNDKLLPNELLGLTGRLSALARRLDPKEAVPLRLKLATLLTGAISKSTNRWQPQWFADSLAMLLKEMDPQEAQEVGVKIIQAIRATTNPYVSQALALSHAAVTARLDSEENEAAAIFVQAMNRMSESDALLSLAESLSALAANLEPKKSAEIRGWVAETFLRGLSKTTDPSLVRKLARGLAEVAARLDPKKAAPMWAKAATTLTARLKEAKNNANLPSLASSLETVACFLDPKDATATRQQLVRVLSQAIITKPVPNAAWLAPHLAAVAAHLDPHTAKEIAATFIQAMSATSERRSLQQLSRGLVMVTAQLDPIEVAAMYAQASAIITPRLSEAKTPLALQPLVLSLGILAIMNPKKADADCAKATAALHQAMSKTDKPFGLGFVKLLSELTVHLDAKKAKSTFAQAAAVVLQKMTATKNPYQLLSLARTLASLTAHLNSQEEEAKCVQARAILNQAIRKSTVPKEASALARGLMAIAARMDLKEAAATRAQAVVILRHVMSKTSDSTTRMELGQVMSEGLVHLDGKAAKEAGAAFTVALNKTTIPQEMGVWAENLAAAATQLDPDEAATMRALAAATLSRAISKTSTLIPWQSWKLKRVDLRNIELFILQSLVRSLAMLAPRLAPGEAEEACSLAARCLIQAMSKTSDSKVLQALSQSLLALLSRESTAQRVQRLRSLAKSMSLATAQVPLPLAVAVLAPALEPVPEPLPPQVLVDLLKHPLCLGEARSIVLKTLGTHYHKSFTDQWDFVRFATEQKLNLDLTSPPKRTELVTSGNR